MKQVLFGQNGGTSGTEYSSIMGQPANWTTEATNRSPWPAAGVLRNLVVELATAPGVGTSRTFTLRLNGANTALTVTISNTATTARLTGVDVAVAVGGFVALQASVTGSPAATANVRWSLEFEGTTAKESAYSQAVGGANNGGGNRATGVFVFPSSLPATANVLLARNVVAAAGTITRMSAAVSSAPGGGNGITLYVNKNGVRQDGTGGTVNTTCALVGAITTVSATYSLPVSPGDLVYTEMIVSGTFTSRFWSVGVAFVATTDGQSHLCGVSVSALSTTLTQFSVVPSASSALSTTETTFANRSIGGVVSIGVSGLQVFVTAAPGTGKSRQIDLRNNTASTALTVTISDAATAASDGVHSATVADGDRWTLRHVPTSTPVAATAHWGLIQSTAVALPPVVDTLPATAASWTTATIHGQILPNGTAMDGRFAWGTSPGALVHETTPVSVGSGLAYVAIDAALTGLDGGTTYYFRAIGDDGTDETLGDILSFTTLPEQVFEDGGVSHPLTWITLTKKDGTKHPYAEVDLNDPEDYYDGYKRPRVERFLTIARGLSDRDGQIEHMSFGAVLSDIATDRFDTHREFRAMLAESVNKYLTNRPLEVWFVDDTVRRLLGLPRLAAVGFVNDYAPTADLHFELKGADWLKKKFSRKRRAQQGWQPLITAADFPACPDDTLNSPAPLVYGSLGLGGAEAVVGVTIMINAQPTAAPANFAVSLQSGGRLAGVRRYYIVVGIVGGQETERTPTLTATTTNTQKTVRLTWDAVPSATAIYVYSSDKTNFSQYALIELAGGATSYDDDTTPPNQDANWLKDTDWYLGQRLNLTYYVYANLGGGLFSAPGQASTYIAPLPPRHFHPELFDRDIVITWTAHAGASGGYRVIRRRSYYSEWDPVFDRQWDPAAGVLTVADDIVTTTAVTVPAGELLAAAAAGQAEAIFVGVGSYGDPTPVTVSALLVARHACARLGAIYIPVTTEAVEGETETTYAAVPDDQYGVTWFAPDHPGWIYPEKYVEINGQWFTLIFTTVEPLPDKVLVDVDGIETAADGTGTLIRSLVDQRLHFMVNFVAPDTPWASGPYLTADDTVFPHLPAIPLVDAASHAAVKASLAARLASGDYEGALILGADREFVSALDALARFQLSGDFDQTFNRKGQDTVTCEPIEANAAAPTIGDVLSIREGSFNLVDQVQSAFFNIIPYVHSRDYTGREHTGWYGNAEIRSDDSITNYDQEREAPRVELHAGRANTPQGAATIADVMARKLARYQDPRRIGSLQMPFEGLEYEPGSTAAITHIEGVGANGWSGREVRIIRHEVEPTSGIVRLDFYDLTAVLENHETLRRRRQGGG